jgi:hypothetical protein
MYLGSEDDSKAFFINLYNALGIHSRIRFDNTLADGNKFENSRKRGFNYSTVFCRIPFDNTRADGSRKRGILTNINEY